MFFEFATHIFNADSNSVNYSKEKLLDGFREFLVDKKFEFNSPAEKLIEQLKLQR